MAVTTLATTPPEKTRGVVDEQGLTLGAARTPAAAAASDLPYTARRALSRSSEARRQRSSLRAGARSTTLRP